MPAFRSPFPNIKVPEVDVFTSIFPKAVKDHGDKVFLINAETGATRTFAEHATDIRKFASGLHQNLKDLKKWDVIAIYSPNHLEYPVIVHGAIKAGFAVTTANHSYTAAELAFQLKDAKAKYLFTVPAAIENAVKAAAEAGISKDRIFLLDPAPGFRTARDLFSDEPEAKVTFSKAELSNNAAYICYSSGTTGRPKGVIITHRNMASNIKQITDFMAMGGDVTPNDIWVGVLPFYHCYGLNISLHSAVALGLSVVVVQQFELERFCSYLSKYGVTMAHVVPPIIVGLAKHPIVEKFDLSKLKYLFSGAAPLGPELTAEVSKRLNVTVLQGYGMTELSPVSHMTTGKNNIPGSVGMLAANMEARIVNVETGKDVGVGQEGELWLRGPNVMKGYLGNAKATAETIDKNGGWLKTGDVAILDKNGNYFIVDRIKELIKYKGLQVAPAELEAYLLGHPAIADCAVIPRPDERAGELPRAYVVLKANAKATEAEIQEFIEKKVSNHKRLRGGVGFIDAIPKSPSGKILRRVLRDMEAAERKSAESAKAKL